MIQGVDGVDWADLDALYRTQGAPGNLPALVAAVPRSGGRSASGPIAAELLTLDPRPLALRLLA